MPLCPPSSRHTSEQEEQTRVPLPQIREQAQYECLVHVSRHFSLPRRNIPALPSETASPSRVSPMPTQPAGVSGSCRTITDVATVTTGIR